MIQYAYKVAGTAGLLMCCVLNTNNPRAKPHAVDLGIGMQLTNIARDVVVDAEMGRRYLPGSWVNDMTPEEILQAAEIQMEKTQQSSHPFADYWLCREVLRKWSHRSILPTSQSTFCNWRCSESIPPNRNSTATLQTHVVGT